MPAFAPILRLPDELDCCVAVCDGLAEELVGRLEDKDVVQIVSEEAVEEEKEEEDIKDVAGPVTTVLPMVYVADKARGASALNVSVVGESQLTVPLSSVPQHAHVLVVPL